jgi:23S rRNA (pseudouridine1915-N3)-methyltransferase
MRLRILAIGRLKRGPELTLCEDYETRIKGLGRQAGITRLEISEFAESRLPTAKQRQDEEVGVLSSCLSEHAVRIVLDERGKSLSSEEFANLFRKHLVDGSSDMAFLIGGPDGHAAKTREAAGMLMSFGPMTWPHRLVRLMLLEQLYRAVTILTHHPYHRAG